MNGCRSEEHTSELQSHSFISYAVFCLKKKKRTQRMADALLTTLITAGVFDRTRACPRAVACVTCHVNRQCFRCYHQCISLFFLMIRRPPSSSLFPSPTLFR